MQAIEDAKEKCRKLTRLMADPAATEGEKRVARSMRRKLMTRHRLKVADLRKPEPEADYMPYLRRRYAEADFTFAPSQEVAQAFAVWFSAYLKECLEGSGVRFSK